MANYCILSIFGKSFNVALNFSGFGSAFAGSSKVYTFSLESVNKLVSLSVVEIFSVNIKSYVLILRHRNTETALVREHVPGTIGIRKNKQRISIIQTLKFSVCYSPAIFNCIIVDSVISW